MTEPADREEIVMQQSPFPGELSKLVIATRYKPAWMFRLVPELDRGQGSRGMTLVIQITTPDAYHPDQLRTVVHYFPVPPAAYDARSWQRWLLEQVLLVERHEACEFFQLVRYTEDDRELEYIERPYAPSHGPGNDPYLIREIGTSEDVRTSFRGVLS